MPTFKNYMNLLFINIIFAIQIGIIIYFTSLTHIKKNWPMYRCNPPYWVFSDNISEDFTHCVQTSQMNTMGVSMQPLTYLMSSIASLGTGIESDINSMRQSSGSTRNFASSILQNIYLVFMGIVINMNKMTINMKDMVSKLTGIITVLLYILDGSNKTVMSTWAGPTGQMVRSLSCFHPNTIVCGDKDDKLKMKNIKPGYKLSDGSTVLAVLKILPQEPLYKLGNVRVAGSHYVWDSANNKFIEVKNHKKSVLIVGDTPKYYSCLITDTGKIAIKNHVFSDWEDTLIRQHDASDLLHDPLNRYVSINTPF